MSVVHLEGMGIMGSLLAPILTDLGVDWTWSDIDEKRVQSWKASTGAIMPFGDDDSMTGLSMWEDMLSRTTDVPTFRELYRPLTQRARFCYYSQNPPHGGKKVGVEEVAKVGGVRFSNMRSFHIDAQQVVQTARSHWRAQRRDSDEALRIVTHGWTPGVIGSYSWGWSAVVKAKISPAVRKQLRELGDKTGCFYMRNGYQIAYLYPVGRTGGHYAGTTLITQKDGPKDADPRPHFERWCKQIEEFSEGHLKRGVLIKPTLQQAWRPKPQDGQPLTWKKKGTIYMRPGYGNGIRMFPLYAKDIVTRLEQAGVL